MLPSRAYDRRTRFWCVGLSGLLCLACRVVRGQENEAIARGLRRPSESLSLGNDGHWTIRLPEASEFPEDSSIRGSALLLNHGHLVMGLIHAVVRLPDALVKD